MEKLVKHINAITWIVMLVTVSGTLATYFGPSKIAYAAGPTPITNNVFPGPYNCTRYAWQRLHNTSGIDLQFYMSDGMKGNAGNWVTTLSSRMAYAAWSERTSSWMQIQFNTAPSVGDIVVVPYKDGIYANTSAGHVAYVEELLANGDFLTSAQDWPDHPTYTSVWNLQNLQIHQHGAARFIHVINAHIPVNPPIIIKHPIPVKLPTHAPIAVKNADGRMEVFEVGGDGQLYYNAEDSGGKWQEWHSLSGNWQGQPAVGINADGRLEIFMIGDQSPGGGGGELFHAYQTRAGDDSSWTGWIPMGISCPPGTLAVTTNLRGGLEVFVVKTDHVLYHAWQVNPGNSSSYVDWYTLGGRWSDTSPVVVKNKNGTMQVFMVGRTTQLYYNQESGNGGWSGWKSLGGSWPALPAVTLNMQGDLEVFIVGNQGPNGGGLFHAWETSPESQSWTRWSALPGAWHPGTPFVATNDNGTMDVFLVGQGAASDGNTALYHDYENTDGSWSGPQSLGGYWHTEPSVTTNLPDGLEVFMTGESGETYHIWENTPGNSSNYIATNAWPSLGIA